MSIMGTIGLWDRSGVTVLCHRLTWTMVGLWRLGGKFLTFFKLQVNPPLTIGWKNGKHSSISDSSNILERFYMAVQNFKQMYMLGSSRQTLFITATTSECSLHTYLSFSGKPGAIRTNWQPEAFFQTKSAFPGSRPHLPLPGVLMLATVRSSWL